MKVLHAQAGTENHQVEAAAVICGTDLSVCICGGDGPHIGASALAVPRPSLRDQTKTSASVSVLTVTGHLEDELAKLAAYRLASALNCRVSVNAGLHIDAAAADDIKRLERNFMAVLEDVQVQVSAFGNIN